MVRLAPPLRLMAATIVVITAACSTTSNNPGGGYAWDFVPSDDVALDSGGGGNDATTADGDSGEAPDTAGDSGGDTGTDGDADAAAEVAPDAPADVATTCKPTTPPTEACDNLDNDCNGQTDDGACDDGNPCTDQACDGGRAAQGLDGCTYALPAGKPCDDGSTCTENDSCTNGLCQAGASKDCNDSNSCTIDKCKASTGQCEHAYVGDGKFCNDGLGCTNNDKCSEGTCKGQVNTSCDDGIPCTIDACDAQGTCTHQQVSVGPCEDGNPCTTNDKCFQGICTPGELTVCDDNKPCTDDYCDALKGGCVHQPKLAGSACADGLCATGGSCDVVGTCQGLKLACDDGKACTVDLCDKATGACTNQANPKGTPCDDGELCTIGEACDDAGACVPPAGQKGCNDGNPCTVDVCNVGTQSCSYQATSGACDDGDGCTAGETCATGACTPGPSPEVKALAGNGVAKYAEGKGDLAQFADPRGISATTSGTMLLADAQNHRIRRLKTDGYADNFVGTGTAGWQDGVAIIVKFHTPLDVVVASNGTVLVADSGNHRIRSIAGDGTTSTAAGSGTAGFLDGAIGTARFSAPAGVAIMAGGAIVVADAGNHRIRKIDGGNVTTLFGTGTAGSADGDDKAAQLSSPADIIVAASGAMYVADSGNHRVRRIVGAAIETFAGSSAGLTDGALAQAKFQQPRALFEDASGRILVADAGNHAVRAIAGGQVQTIAGTGKAGFADGPGYSAQFSSPGGVWADKAGKVYVVDSGNHRVRTAEVAVKVCNDGNACTKDSCDKASGACVFDTLQPGDLCDDGNACTEGETCDFAGQCAGKGKTCDDGSSCTDDNCDAISGQCVHKPTAKGCDDGDACTQGDNCVAGACVSGAGDISTLAGSSAGSADGKGAAATFSYPEDVAADLAGNAYVADASNARIRKVTADGTVTTLVGTAGAGFADGPANVARFNLPTALTVDAKGTIFVADKNNHRIRKVLADGTTSTLAGNGNAAMVNGKGSAASFYSPTGITLDPAGNLYVVDAGTSVVRKVTVDGVVTTLAGSSVGFADGAGSAAKFYQPLAITFSPKGFLLVADASNHRIRKVDLAGNVSTLAGTGTSGATDGPGDKAQFSSPGGLVIDANGDLLVSERSGHRLRRVAGNGDVATLSGGQAGFADGKPTTAQFNTPAGMARLPDGAVLLADRQNHRIRKMASTKSICFDGLACTLDSCNKTSGKCVFAPIPAGGVCDDGDGCTVGDVCDAAGKCAAGKAKTCNDNNDCSVDSCNPFGGDCLFQPSDGLCSDGQFCTVNDRCANGVCVGDKRDVTTLAGQASTGLVDGKGALAKFYTPQGIAVDSQGNTWVSDYSGNAIRKVTSKGVVTTMAGNLQAGYLDGPGLVARFNSPSSLEIDGSGGVWIADRQNMRIRHMNAAGLVTTIAGSGSATNIDGKGTAAAFYYPEGLARAPNGDVYIANTYSHRIRKMTPDGTVTTIAGTGSSTWKDGPLQQASFYYPRGLAVDAAGNLYVADTTNHRIRKIDFVKGEVTTLAGSGGASFADGKGAQASFSSPYDVAVDPQGNVWVADVNNHRLRMIAPDGTVTVAAGSGTSGWKDDVPEASLFSGPRGVAIDSKSNVLIADGNNQRIRKMASPFNDCDDGTECTVNACDEAKKGCSATAVGDGQACIDGKPCLANRICNQGVCVGGVPKQCDDKNACTVDSCNAITGECDYKADNSQGCQAQRRVFVTAATWQGNVGGVAAADNACIAAAKAANLGGTWKAWLSMYDGGSNPSPLTTFAKSSAPYRRLDGATVALNWNDLVDGKLENPIDVTELGVKVGSGSTNDCGGSYTASVWTGTSTAGQYYTSTTSSTSWCSSWQTPTTSSSYKALIGNAGATDSTWTYGCSSQCANKAHLYCFEQTDSFIKL